MQLQPAAGPLLPKQTAPVAFSCCLHTGKRPSAPFDAQRQRNSIRHPAHKPARGQRVACAADFSSSVKLSQESRQNNLQQQIAGLTACINRLAAAPSLRDKLAQLQQEPPVKSFLNTHRLGQTVLQELVSLTPEQAYVILCLPVLGQEHVLAVAPPAGTTFRAALHKLAEALAPVDKFYDSMGGLLGYQRQCLEIIVDSMRQHDPCSQLAAPPATATQHKFHMPRGPDLEGPNGRQLAAESAAAGLEALPHMAEIYPLGGAGDRLGLTCEVTGEALPVCVLPYCGRPLLESLIRDVQAREYLYYKLHGVQQMTPIVIMTSDAKGNHARVTAFLKQCNWFGRGKESFKIFKQPLVPVLEAEDGRWLLPQGLSPMLKPGGHGAIWKLMLDAGVFEWLGHHGRQAAIVRQISNPMAGTDATLFALSGAGFTDGRSFGFASCPRVVGAAEGMNVLLERISTSSNGTKEHAYNVTNVEYTEFEKMGICDVPEKPGSQYSRFPANTNVLYVNMKAAEAAVRAGVAMGGGAALPGMIFNMKKKVGYHDAAAQQERSVHAGRLECTMQNLVDSMAQRFREAVPVQRHGELNTFVVYNARSRVTSSAKRKRVPGSLKIHQTPDGSFLDLMRNAHDLLTKQCGFHMPEVGDVQHYLGHGPNFLCLYHPGLGPLWDIISQKVQRGSLTQGSELVLEVAEAAINDLHVNGSFIVQADCVLGKHEPALAVNYNQIRSRQDIQARQLSGRQHWLDNMFSRSGKQRRMSLEQEFQEYTRQQSSSSVDDSVESSKHLAYSSRCGRVRLHGVTVRNNGVSWSHPDNCYWQHKVHRHETARVILRGRSEFEAVNVTINGDQCFEVPDGYKMVLTAGPAGGLRTALHQLGPVPSWEWQYCMTEHGSVRLHFTEAQQLQQHIQRAEAETIFDHYMI